MTKQKMALRPVRPGSPDFSNWGAFGDDDEIGTLNYLTRQAVMRGVSAVKVGDRYPLSLPVDVPSAPDGRPAFKADGPKYEHNTFRNNQRRNEGIIANDDAVTLSTQATSQWDALVHVGMEEDGVAGVFYNGAGLDAVDDKGYAHKNGIDKVARAGIVGRGVLLDMARFLAAGKATPLPLDYRITPQETAACAKAQGVEIESGDIVCFRTGYAELHLDAKDGDWDAEYKRLMYSAEPGGLPCVPGITPEHTEMAHAQQWAAVVADNTAVEALPFKPSTSRSAHIRMLRNLGMIFGELFLLRDLAAACAADRRYEFLFVGAPLWIPGGMGSPANSMAIR